MSNHILSRISELHSSIDSLRNQCTNDPDRIEKALTGALEELQAIQQELQAREQYEITKAEPILKPDGEIDSLICTCQDVTKLDRAEKALQQSEERYRLLIKNAPSMIYEVDFQGHRFKSVNDEMCKTLGYTREELLGMDPSDLLEGTSKTAFMERIRKTQNGEPIKDFIEYRVKTKDGRELSGALRTTIIFKNGQPESALVVAHDFTERKQMEMKLARMVLERTEALSKAKLELEAANEELRLDLVKHERLEAVLVEAKEAAEAAARAKSDFLASMSHEIRTPMNAVIGMTSVLLADEELNPEHRDLIETIRMSGDALMVIINDILDFSKMQENKIILEDQPFDLRDCIEEALDLVAGKASEKCLNLAYTMERTVPEVVTGDPNRLRQILSNLLINAVKFTERGEVGLSVSGLNHEGSHEIRFAIQDTGIGISPDQMNHLFQPFSQVDAKGMHNYGDGTGLGLVISKKLVELMDGRIWADSELGKGSTFYFTIKAETIPGDPNKCLVEDLSRLVGKHVLIVHNDKTNRRILSSCVYSWGMVPLVASKTEEALDWIRRGDAFDVAILDLDMDQDMNLDQDMDMQDMDGATLADEIRKYNKTLPLVVLASIGLHQPTHHAHLTKPIKPTQLHRILTDVISVQPRESDRFRAVDREIPAKSLRILLAEDNVTSQKVALKMLMRLGFNADVVANGIEALQALERQHYDLVLMDLRMPIMNGLEATRIIRQRWPDNGPRVVALTAYALQGDRDKCMEAGMDDYISKPIKLEELAEALSKYQSKYQKR